MDRASRLVVIDPLVAFLGETVNSYRDQDVRRALAPLAQIAEETGAAIIVVRHLNKTHRANPLYRGGGSIGIIGAARAGLLAAEDPEDSTRRVLAVTKCNLAPLAPALTYRIEAAEGTNAPQVAWIGPSNLTARQLLAPTTAGAGAAGTALEEACAFLGAVLGDGPVPAVEIERRAKEAGLSMETVRAAKTRIGITTRKEKVAAGRWMWILPCGGRAGTP